MKKSTKIQIVKELTWSEKELPQRERTKHVHSLHQYTGKYIPQLVDFFLENDLKRSKIILDPFTGSGTTLVQANLHGIPSIGIDVSRFNVLLTNVKIQKYNISLLKKEITDILTKTISYNETIDWDIKQKKFRAIPRTNSDYLNEWYSKDALISLLIFKNLIANYRYQNVLKIILSRSARSSRMAPHHELNFPDRPYKENYYCYKHSCICRPTMNSMIFIKKYCKDVLRRLTEFNELRKDVYTKSFFRDSRKFDFSERAHKIDGVITSPPYVGMMNYHEQHRYAYELFGIKDNSENEIGSRFKGIGKIAISKYKSDISRVFKNIIDNALDYKNGKVIIVVDDKLNIYDDIVDDSDMMITKRLKRRVDRRTGRPDLQFFEDIIVCKAKKK